MSWSIVFRYVFQSKIAPLPVVITKAKRYFYMRCRELMKKFGSSFDFEASKDSWVRKISNIIERTGKREGSHQVARVEMFLDVVQMGSKYMLNVSEIRVIFYEKVNVVIV